MMGISYFSLMPLERDQFIPIESEKQTSYVSMVNGVSIEPFPVCARGWADCIVFVAIA